MPKHWNLAYDTSVVIVSLTKNFAMKAWSMRFAWQEETLK